MKFVNNATLSLSGILDLDPEMRFTSGGKAVVNFYINGRKCEAWDTMAEKIAQVCIRGTVISITGIQRQRSWKNREDKTITETVLVISSYQTEPPF